MGGGGSYYDRDVTSTSRRTSRGYTDVAESLMSKSRVDKALLPKGRKLISKVKNPFVCPFDDTGSMGTLPKILCDKWPMVVGQIYMNKYLDPKETEVSLSAVGDILSDEAPIQICDFSKLRSLDEWLSRIWLEGNGGGQAKESYEMNAYFYARMCSMPNTETPIYMCTGDEGFRENLIASDLRDYFGGEHENVSAWTIFEELKKKFKGNVFLIHREYGGGGSSDEWITKQWKRALGSEHVIILPEDLAIADIMLGVVALVSGARTLDEYVEDMKNRPLDLGGEKFAPQSPERIKVVRNALEELADYLASSRKDSLKAKRESKSERKQFGKKDAGKKDQKSDKGWTL